MQEKKKIHYAWVILIACCVINFGGLGTLFNTSGIFFPSVTKDLGIGVGDISLYMTILSLFMVFTLPFVAKLLPKLDVRLTLSTAFGICVLAVAAMSQFTAVWQWYISGAIIGIAGAFIFFVPVPVILGNWFHKKAGLALGIVGSFTGIGGAIMNPVISSLIVEFGWRNAYLITAVIVAVVVLPFTLFVVRFKPEDKGLQPYGYEADAQEVTIKQAQQSGISVKAALTSLTFFFLIMVAGLSGFLSGFNQLLASYADSVGLTAALGASLLSASMIANITSKFLFGAACDKFGVKNTTNATLLIIALGFGLFYFSDGGYTTLLIASALYGIHAPVIVIGLPLICRETFGNKNYSSIFSYLSMGQAFIKAFGFAIYGFIYDMTNSYQPAFILSIIVCMLMIIFTIGTFKFDRNTSFKTGGTSREVANF